MYSNFGGCTETINPSGEGFPDKSAFSSLAVPTPDNIKYAQYDPIQMKMLVYSQTKGHFLEADLCATGAGWVEKRPQV